MNYVIEILHCANCPQPAPVACSGRRGSLIQKHVPRLLLFLPSSPPLSLAYLQQETGTRTSSQLPDTAQNKPYNGTARLLYSSRNPSLSMHGSIHIPTPLVTIFLPNSSDAAEGQHFKSLESQYHMEIEQQDVEVHYVDGLQPAFKILLLSKMGHLVLSKMGHLVL